jgi:beta-glucanase (GH16 family)
MSRLMWMLALFFTAACDDAQQAPASGDADAGNASPREPDADTAGGDGARADAARDAPVASDAAADARVANDGATALPASQDAAPRDAAVVDGGLAATPDAATEDEAALPGWKIVWRDEFAGAKGALPSPERWLFETGGHGFGNNQLEFDTARPENAALDGEGKLVITARREDYMGKRYTSARLKTQGKFERVYGRYEARMKLPRGQGIWPAFWMLGSDIERTSWPACGEIDIMENIGREPSRIHGTLHGPGYSGGNSVGAPFDLPAGRAFADDFHLFAIEWEANVVRWYVDGKLYQTRAPRDLPSGAKWVYDHPFFLLLNLAVGGQWPGSPDDSTSFPQQLTVDYVRVYERVP